MTASDRMSPVNDGELYELHGRALVAFAASIVGPSDAPDVVHDAAIALFESGSLAGVKNPKALMYRAVFAKAKTMQRSMFKRRARERRFAESVVYHDPEVLPDVATAVVGLSPQQRASIFLTYWEDMTPAAIGDLLGIAEGTVKHHLAVGREKLRRVLE
jgi:RNA polymerase sigma factor (sigma-70 family)